MNIAVTGGTGRMGRTVIETAVDRDDVTVALAVSRDPPDRIAGVRIDPADAFPELVVERRPNAVIDFTVPESSVSYVEAAADAAVPAVVGTTGFDDAELERLRSAAERVPVLRASNFARGLYVFMDAVATAAEALPGYDVEVTETHHAGKTDAPSGTAVSLLDRIETARGGGERVHGRVGEAPRGADEIGVHARRAGGIRGEHEALLAGNDEVLTLTHRVESRRVFATGALDAAVWLAGQPPDYYAFEDVIADVAP